MKRYTTAQLQPGMIVGRPVYTSQGQLIISTDTVLTEDLISRLRFYGIMDAIIQDPVSAEKPAEPAAPKPAPEPKKAEAPRPATRIEQMQSHAQKVKQTPEFRRFQVNYSREMCVLQNTLSDVLMDNGGNIDTQDMLDKVGEMIQDTKSTQDIFDMLNNIRLIDDSIYAHSLNVALMSATLGNWLRFSKEEQDLLTLCGLFHDIGKTVLPLELLNKPGKYTPEEYEAVKQHPLLGYQIVKDQDLNVHIKNAVLMHHERCDGSGYPQGLTDAQLDKYSMIVAIADVYDAMTAARSYRKPLCPFQVIDAFEKEGLQKYHPQYILTFLEHIADTYQHSRVMLNNGQSGIIAMINKSHLTQPYIQMDDGSILDMTTKPGLEIVSVT